MAYDEEADYSEIRSLKRDDSYSFTYTITYILEKLREEAFSDDDYVLGTTTIDVRVDWFDGDGARAPGYHLTYRVNEYDKMPFEFNGTEADVLNTIYSQIQGDLDAAGIAPAVEIWP